MYKKIEEKNPKARRSTYKASPDSHQQNWKPWRSGVYSLFKRLVDVTVAVVCLTLFSPPMVLIAILIRLESKGPVFFRQDRLGRNRKPFRIWKYRTMVLHAEESISELEHLNDSPQKILFKIKYDPRVTFVGRYLRRTSLDELPQLFNVVLGHMSLVGPRPLPLRDCALLQEWDSEVLSRRLEILPGMTGIWQVNGRSDMGVEQMLDLDLYYVHNRSLALDFWILLQTVWVVLSGKGAY